VITIVVPALPPSANHMYVTLRGGKKALSAETETFRALVWADVLHAPERPVLPDGPLALTLRLTYGTKRRQDLDNRIKSAQDAVALALRFDDCRIARITAENAGYDPGRPLCEMTLEAL
jgi:Holliday junction resolvase RusA-like endonuclease